MERYGIIEEIRMKAGVTMKKGLTATQLKLIAVIAMVCDHLTWAVLDSFTLLSQILHTFGQISIPIICFLLVEGYRHTKNLTFYMFRLILCWIVSIYPFYLYFNGVNGMRQSFLFEILIGLMVLAVNEDETYKKTRKITVILILTIVSVSVGSFPIVPLIFILIFYHSDTFRQKAIRLFIFTVAFVLSLVCFILWNQQFHLIEPGWQWNQKLYYLGFILAIPFLKLYNGKLGAKPNVKYFFYAFYPLHFILILLLNKQMTYYQCYIYLNLLNFLFVLTLGYKVIHAKVSRVLIANLLLIMFVLVYMVGDFIELTTRNLDVIRATLKIQYLGMIGVLMALIWFVDLYCSNKFSKWFYYVQGIFSMVMIGVIFTMEHNTSFYKSLSLKDYGSHAAIVIDPGGLYYVFYIYVFCICMMIEVLCYKKIKISSGVEKKRSILIFIGVLSPIIFLAIKWLGLTKEFDLITYGMFGFTACYTAAIIGYDYFDSVQTEGETDDLTGVSKRMYFIERVKAYLHEKRQGSLFMLDMDNFKYVNDNFGHRTGDEVLRMFANTLKMVLGEGHLICRLGGDEFSVFLVGITRKKDLADKADRIIEGFQKQLAKAGLNCNVTCSIGISIYYGNGEEVFETLYENADKALYLVKNSGKNQYKFYK